MTNYELKTKINESVSIIPPELSINPLVWKYFIRSILKGKNILVVGPSGCGKTQVSKDAAKAMNRPFFEFNCGSMQDPRTSLIGTKEYSKELGTYFVKSQFIKAITTENCVIFLDELSRCHPDGWNILMTVLDPIQRYVRIDEHNGEIVNVAKGVCFISAANIGNEYTATKVMDKALVNRFTVIVEMDYLNKEDELKILKNRFKNFDDKVGDMICDIAAYTRQDLAKNSKLTNCISTRSVLECAEMIEDGFLFKEVLEAVIYPLFSKDGDLESERTFVKQYAQKFIEEHESDETSASKRLPNALKNKLNAKNPF